MNPIEGIDEEWSKYRNEDELGIKYTPKGKLSYYEGGGFVKDFDKDLNYEEFRLEIDRLIKFDFLNDETAAIFVQFTSYLPYSNIWIYNHLMLERNL